MTKNLVISLVIVALAVSCRKNDLDPDLSQPILFEYEFINNAWGYQHLGWMIDAHNRVRGYFRPDIWNHPDENGLLSKAELLENLDQSDTTYFKVNSYYLNKYFDDRFEIQGAPVDTSDLYMADAGMGVLYVYVWDSSEEKYSRVLLASRGDIMMTNSHSKTEKVVKWLETVGKQTDRFYWFDN